MNCAKCDGKAMEHLGIKVKDAAGAESEIALDRCPGCAGVWFDAGEIDRYISSRTENVPVVSAMSIFGTMNDSAPGKCPRCSVSLTRGQARANARITVDRCDKCNGVWFDGGELQRVGKSAGDFRNQLQAAFGDIGK